MADEKINVKITGDYDDKAATDALADAKQIEKADPTLDVTADTTQAQADLGKVAEQADALSKSDRQIKIEAQIEAAEADIKRLNTELASIDDTATTTGHKIGTEIEGGTSKAKDATHSLAGAAIGDTAAAATGFGALGESISQMTEGILAGEVGMKDLLSAGIAMGGIALVVSTVTKALAEAKAVDAFNAKKVEEFTKALREGKTVIDSLRDSFTQTGKIEFADQVTGKTKDLTAALGDAGITFDTFLDKVALGKEGFRQWVIANGEAIGAGGDLNAIIQAGNQFIDDRAAAEKTWQQQQVVSGATAAETQRELNRLNNTFETGTDSIDHNTKAMKNSTTQVDKFKEQTALADGAYRHLTDALDEQQAWADVNQAIDDYNSKTSHSEEETRNQIRAIADYVDTTDTIPESKKTEIFAALDQGDVAEAQRQLDELTKQRDLKILLTAVGSKDTIKLLKTIGRGGTGIVDESLTAASASVQIVNNVTLPRGARTGDISKALGVSARRNGTRFNNVVTYARH